jgi:IS5 family transposase
LEFQNFAARKPLQFYFEISSGREPFLSESEGMMRPKQQATTGSGDLFRAMLEQIINMKNELVQLAGRLVTARRNGQGVQKGPAGNDCRQVEGGGKTRQAGSDVADSVRACRANDDLIRFWAIMTNRCASA